MMIGGACGAFYGALTHVAGYMPGASNFLTILSFSGGNSSNLINAVVACGIAFIVATVTTYLIGFKED